MKSFTEMFKQDLMDFEIEKIEEASKSLSIDNIKEYLRSKGYKIRLVTPTKFGTQLDLFLELDDETLDYLTSNKVKFKVQKKSIFIEI